MDNKAQNKNSDLKNQNTETPIKNNEAFKITGNWEDQSEQLREKFPQLTDSDLEFEAGQEEELLGRLQTRLNKKRDEVISIIRKSQMEKV